MNESATGDPGSDTDANGDAPDVDPIQSRLDELRTELAAGERRLAELDLERPTFATRCCGSRARSWRSATWPGRQPRRLEEA